MANLCCKMSRETAITAGDGLRSLSGVHEVCSIAEPLHSQLLIRAKSVRLDCAIFLT